jgi:tetratricopeptide (TPR) repeat protein
VFSARGAAQEVRGDLTGAAQAYAAALDLAPRHEAYATHLGRVWMKQAESDAGGRDGWLERTEALFEEWRARRPLDPAHPRSLGKLHRLWARLATDQAVRRRHYRLAAEHFGAAVERSPGRPELWNERAALHVQAGEHAKALELLGQSLSLHPGYATTYLVRARAHEARGAWLALQPSSTIALRGRARAMEAGARGEER